MPSKDLQTLQSAILALVPEDGTTIGNGALRQALSNHVGKTIDQAAYDSAKDAP